MKIKDNNNKPILLEEQNVFKKDKNLKPLQFSTKKKEFNFSTIQISNKKSKKVSNEIASLINPTKENNHLKTKNYSDIIFQGKLFFYKKENIEISFKWPIVKNLHNKIYYKLTKCSKVKSVILGNDNIIYSSEGIISEQIIENYYSPFLRLPNYSSVIEEKNTIEFIKKKYKKAANGRILRIFDINVDAYILGKFQQFAKNEGLPMKKISGVYSISNNNLILDNLYIDNKILNGKIILLKNVDNC